MSISNAHWVKNLQTLKYHRSDSNLTFDRQSCSTLEIFEQIPVIVFLWIDLTSHVGSPLHSIFLWTQTQIPLKSKWKRQVLNQFHDRCSLFVKFHRTKGGYHNIDFFRYSPKKLCMSLKGGDTFQFQPNMRRGGKSLTLGTVCRCQKFRSKKSCWWKLKIRDRSKTSVRQAGQSLCELWASV